MFGIVFYVVGKGNYIFVGFDFDIDVIDIFVGDQVGFYFVGDLGIGNCFFGFLYSVVGCQIDGLGSECIGY